MKTLRLELPNPPGGRLGALDELKGVAIILVVLYHAGGVLGWQNLLHGDLGVDIFVILSGIGLALGGTPVSAAQFFRRRFLRIYPAYWTVLTAYAIANTHFLQLHYSALNLALHYAGIHAWFGDFYGLSIDDSFWFITLIVSAYVLYWLLRPLLARPDKLILVAGAICLVPLFAFFFAGQSGIFGHVALRLPGFFLGLLIGRLLKEGRLELPLTAIMGAALLLVLYAPYTQGIQFGTVVVGLALMAAYAFLIRKRTSEKARGTLKYLGDRSLEIFLIHQPLIREYNVYLQGRWFHDAAPSTGSLIIGMGVGLIVTLLVSAELHSALKKLNPAPVSGAPGRPARKEIPSPAGS